MAAPQPAGEHSMRTGERRRSRSKCSRRSNNRWRPDEQEQLVRLVERYGTKKKWSEISEHIEGRTGKQCRERWMNHLRPDIRKDKWTQEEELTMIQLHSEVGTQWTVIAKTLKGRTENATKNHWNTTVRSKTRPVEPSVLWEYIALVKAGRKPKEAHAEALAQVGLRAPAEAPALCSASSGDMDDDAGGDAESDWGSDSYEDADTQLSGKRKAASMSNLCKAESGASRGLTLVVEELPDALAPMPFSEVGASLPSSSLPSRASAPAMPAAVLDEDGWPQLPTPAEPRAAGLASHHSAQSVVGTSPLDIIGTARRLISSQARFGGAPPAAPAGLARRASIGGPPCPVSLETRCSRQGSSGPGLAPGQGVCIPAAAASPKQPVSFFTRTPPLLAPPPIPDTATPPAPLRPPLSAFATPMGDACSLDSMLQGTCPIPWAPAPDKAFFYREEPAPTPDTAADVGGGHFGDFFGLARAPPLACDTRDVPMWQPWGHPGFFLPEPTESTDFLSRHHPG